MNYQLHLTFAVTIKKKKSSSPKFALMVKHLGDAVYLQFNDHCITV